MRLRGRAYAQEKEVNESYIHWIFFPSFNFLFNFVYFQFIFLSRFFIHMPKFLTLEVAVEMVLTYEADTINILPPKEDQLLTDREDFDDEDLTVIKNNVSIDARFMQSDACGRVDEEN